MKVLAKVGTTNFSRSERAVMDASDREFSSNTSMRRSSDTQDLLVCISPMPTVNQLCRNNVAKKMPPKSSTISTTTSVNLTRSKDLDAAMSAMMASVTMTLSVSRTSVFIEGA